MNKNINWPKYIYKLDRYSCFISKPGNVKKLDYVFGLVDENITEEDKNIFLGFCRINNFYDDDFYLIYKNFDKFINSCSEVLLTHESYERNYKKPTMFKLANEKIKSTEIAKYRLINKNIINPANLIYNNKRQGTVNERKEICKHSKLVKRITNDVIFLDNKYLYELVIKDLKDKIDTEQLKRKILSLEW